MHKRLLSFVLSFVFMLPIAHTLNAQSCINAQLEMATGAGNPTANGPSVANQVITFQNNTNNPTGTTMAAFAPAVTTTYTLSNQQYTGITGLTGNYANGIVYGAGLNSTAATMYATLGAIGSATATNFSSTPYEIGAGISTTVNYGPRFLFGTRGIQNAVGSTQLTSSFYMGDITITFNQPVDYPILNFSDFGGFLTSGTTHTFSLQAKITSGQTLTMLSGDAGVSVVGGDSIGSTVSGTTAATNFLDGCFMVNQSGVTSITFKTYLQGMNNIGSWSGTAAGNNSGEAIVISITIPDLVPNAPIATSTSVGNNCPSTTANLNTVLPAPEVGTIYEWHSASPATTGNLVANPTAVPTGTYYLFSKDSLTGCFSSTGDTVVVNIFPCSPSCIGSTPGASGGDGKVDYSIWDITGLASGNAWFNQTNATTAHLNPATQNIKYGDIPGTTLAPTTSGVAPVSFTLGSTPFYDEQTSLSVGHFVQIEGYIGIPCGIGTIQFEVVNDGSGVGGSTVRENYSSLHLAVNGGTLTTNAADLTLVAKEKTNFAGTLLDTDPATAGTQDLVSPIYTTAQAGQWVRFADVISNGAQRYGSNIRWSLNGGPFVNIPASAFQSISGNSSAISSCACPTLPDCDNDGVPNIADIDDDNDGVVDTLEQGCGTTGAWTSAGTGAWISNISPNLKVKVTFADVVGSGAWSVPGTPIANFARNCNDYTTDYAPIVNVNKPALQFTKASGTSVGSFKVEYLDANNNPVLMPNARMHLGGLGGSFGAGQIGSSAWKLQGGLTMTTLSQDIVDFGTTSDSIYHPRLFAAGTGVNDCATGEGDATLVVNGSNSSFTYNVKMFGATIDQMVVMFEGCDQLDTDHDGMLNICDNDDDGDGCPTAYESGASTCKTCLTVAGPYGINGLANSIESNDSLSATVSYSSTYTTKALDSAFSQCKVDTTCGASTNIVTNGGFQTNATTGSLAGWTTPLVGTGWTGNITHGASNSTDVLATDSVAQTIKICELPTNDLVVDFDLKIRNGAPNGLTTYFDVFFNGVRYMRVAPSNANNTIDTIIYYNGASGSIPAGVYNSATSPFPISTGTTPPTTFGHASLTIPVPADAGQGLTGRLSFGMTTGAGSGAHDDFFFDNVDVQGANCLNAGNDTTVCNTSIANLNGKSFYQGTTTWTALGTNPGSSTIASASSTSTTVSGFSAAGTYQYAISNGTCSDTVSITVNNCIVVIPDTVVKVPACPTCPINTCATANDLPAGAGTITYSACTPTPAGFGTQTQNPTTGCITFTPNGTQGPMDTVKTCVVACKNGVCDTTYVIIPPVVVPDTVTKVPTCPTCPINACATADDLSTAPGTITYSACTPTPAGFGTQTQNPTTGCITFTPNGTQGPMDTVKTCVVACKNGICDTTYVIIPPVMVPDTVTKVPTCLTCPVDVCATADDLSTAPGSVTYSACTPTPAGFGTQTQNPTTGCITFTPNGTQGPMDTVKTCVVACKNGVCDTTYVIIPPVVVPDTVIKVPTCPTCPVDVCATADDLSTAPGTATYSACTPTPAGFGTQTQNPTTGCITFTPNGTQGPMDTVKTCVVACKNGVCDTTYVIIPPVVVPDTVTKVPSCPTCPINACATADDLSTAPGTTTYSACTPTPAGFGTQTQNPTTGCITFTPNGTQGPMDTVKTCVVACKNGVCDTTYVIIPPSIIPDTITLVPACPTCPVSGCATADDLSTAPGTTTYSTCGVTPSGMGALTLNPTTGCITFTPNGSQGAMDTVKTCVVACKLGVCDTTFIIIPPVPTPDTIIKVPSCPTCAVIGCATKDDLSTNLGITTYSACTPTPSGFGTQTLNTTTGCITFIPNGMQGPMDTVKTCIVACKLGVCDTTYIIIPPLVVPDTVIITPACPTCPVDACATADDLSTTPGTTTYTACTLTPSGFGTQTLNPTTGCITFTPNGTQGVNDTLKTCVVACKDGVCDTTYIIINPPVRPDSISTQPNCPTCPTDPLCATADHIPSGPGAVTYSTCGLQPGTPGTLSSINPSTGCMVFTGTTAFTSDTVYTCIVACKNGICDTTYITIYPPVPPYGPDTVNVQVSCPTCPTLPICATADDLPSSGTITYQNCGIDANEASQGLLIVNPTTGCAIWSPNGTQHDTISTCVVTCKGGVCDTTFIFIAPPPIPDTVIVQPTCITCPTTPVCPTADDLPLYGTASYSNCGLDANESTQGTLTVDANGCATWTPNGTQTDTITTCVVQCINGICDTTFIIIPPAPVQPNPDVNITWAGIPVPGDVSTNDDNIPTGSTYHDPAPNPSNPDGSMPVINPDGTYTFTSPIPGVFHFMVPTVLPNGDTLMVALDITVLDSVITNNPPVANTDIASTAPSTPVTLNTLSNDLASNTGDTLVPSTVVVTDPPSNGTTSVDPLTGDITYTPNPGFTGTDTLTYQVCDSQTPAQCATAIQIITVVDTTSANTTSAADDYNSTKMNTPVSGSVKTNDTDAEGDAQTVTPQVTSIPGKGTLVLNNDGTYTFTPEDGYTGPVNFPYTTVDSKGDTASATLYILIAPLDPVPNPDVNATWVNIPVTGDVSTNDNNYPIGTTYGGPTAQPGNPDGSMPVINPDGTYTFTSPVPGVYHYLVPVQPCPTCPIDSVLLTITVLDSAVNNNPPAANTDLAATPKDVPVTLSTLSNDKSSNLGLNGELNPASVTITDQPNHGTVTVDPLTGNTTYTPNPGFVGIDTLYYQVCDKQVPPQCATAAQIITIVDTASAPNTTLASDDYNVATNGSPVSGNAMSNDMDVEGDEQVITPQSTDIPGKGSIVLQADGSYVFTPTAGYVGPVEFPYETVDAKGAKAQATIYFLVTSTTPLPAVLTEFTLNELNCTVRVSWVTSQEMNVNTYEVQKEIKGIMKTIGEVKAVGNSSEPQYYHFVDGNVTDGMNTYQLRVVDIDGRISYSDSRSINVECAGNEISLYPNPAGAFTNLIISTETNDEYEIKVMDIAGKVVYTTVEEVNHQSKTIKIPTHTLANGMYSIVIVNSGDVHVLRFEKITE